MHYLCEENLFIFLLQIFVLLSGAKVMGSLFRRWGYPELVGEILTGILLGPTIFARIFPAGFKALFPRDLIQQNMLETVSWLGVLFLLLATGFEISISSVWKQGKAVLTIGTVGVIIPIAIGVVVFCWLPSTYWGPNANRLIFTLFLATAAAISAIPIIAKVLHDLEILKTDLGLTTLSAFVVNDLLGWMFFTMVLGLAAERHANVSAVLQIFFGVILFGSACLTVGSKLVGGITKRLKRTTLPQPATTLSFIACLGMLSGVITQWIGVHAILGFFLAGIMAGNTSEISEQTRDSMSQLVHAIFVPLFFATIGIKIDFLSNLDILLVVVFTTVAIGGKFVGAWIGSIMAHLSRDDALSLGIAHIPGGAMEIVIGMLALELNLITGNVFVAIVFAALSSSIVVGPLLDWSIKRRKPVEISDFLLKEAILADLKGHTREEVIEEIGEAIGRATARVDAEEVISTVKKREEVMGTGIEKGLAIPHGRLSGIEMPIIAFGRSHLGVDWDARDGLPSHFIFLVLTPEREEDVQVQILAAIARCMMQPDIPGKLLESDSPEAIYRILKSSLCMPYK